MSDLRIQKKKKIAKQVQGDVMYPLVYQLVLINILNMDLLQNLQVNLDPLGSTF